MANAVVSDWPSGVTNTGWPSEPSAMLMPGRVQGWPAGTQRAANAAQRLLSQAVAWWDVEQYRDGDRFLRNQGTAGELLNLRLGSSIVANSNDPLYLEPTQTGYVYVPGSNSNALTVPDENALDLQDIEIVFRVSMDDWTPAANTIVLGKGGAAATANYRAQINTTGVLLFSVGDGTTAYTATSGNPGFTDGQTYWVKITRVASTGLCDFYWAGDSVSEPTTWTTISTGVSSGYTGTLTTNSNAVGFGGASGSSSVFAGRLYRLIIRSSVGGSTVLDIDCDAITSGSATSFTAATGQTVTISRATSGRKSVCVPARRLGGKPVMLLGNDDYLEVQDTWQHQMLNFNQGDRFTALVAIRQWANVVSGGRYLSKYDSAGGAGWALTSSTTTQGATGILTDGTTTATATSSTSSAGAIRVFSVTSDAAARSLTAALNGVAGTAAAAGLPAANALPLRVGRQSGDSTTYQDFEFIAAAVFRRALTRDEIATITRHYTGA